MPKKKIVVGNWKMNPDTPKEAKELAQTIKKAASRFQNVTTVLCPPSIFIPAIYSKSKVSLGAQNLFYEEKGSYTGEISAKQIRENGATYVIVGHSERRKLAETDEIVAKKALKAVASGLTPIVCIGEEVHDHDGNYLETIKRQLLESLRLIKSTEIWKVIIAYEPIWAIGADRPMTSYDLHQMSLYIRKVLLDMYGKAASGVNIVYGGSVDADNAAEIIKNGEVDGLLVGRESLNAERFIKLLKAVNSI